MNEAETSILHLEGNTLPFCKLFTQVSLCPSVGDKVRSSMHPLIHSISHPVHISHLERRGELSELVPVCCVSLRVRDGKERHLKKSLVVETEIGMWGRESMFW